MNKHIFTQTLPSNTTIEDIACTKLHTISARGSKKDFIDLFYILERFSLSELFMMLENKYAGTTYNTNHILKSLTYFEDANKQPMPRMEQNQSWEDIKQDITKSIRSFKLI